MKSIARRYGLAALAAWGVVASATVSPAALLGLTQKAPDISSQPVSVNYDAGTGEFRVTGSVLSGFDIDGSQPPEYTFGDFGGTPSYVLSVFLSNTGTPLSGSLTIGGTLPALGANSGTLLTGTINQFGFQNAGPFGASLFEFEFLTTGGDLKPTYFPDKAQVILSAVDPNTTYNGTFTSNFSFLGRISQTDTFSHVPEPAAGLLMLLSLPALVGRMRRWRKSRVLTGG